MFHKFLGSIRSKLLLLIVAVTFLALLLSGVALIIFEPRTYHTQWVQDLETQADILGRSTVAALAFNDPRAAQENVDLLRARPAILAAAVYDARGTLFASYTKERSLYSTPDRLASLSEAVKVQGRQIIVFRRIDENHTAYGAVAILATYAIAERMTNYAGILVAVMLLSLAAAVLVGIWLQRKITEPILAVAKTAHDVIDTRDFSLRVPKTTSDELGYLVDAFNTMLSEIGSRSAALLEADLLKDQFLATLAHELRNPLAPISNALHLLRRRGAAQHHDN